MQLTEENIRKFFKDMEDPNSEVSRLIQEGQKRWDKILQPQLDAIRESTRITAEDLAIVVD
jgi:hypothetical protein